MGCSTPARRPVHQHCFRLVGSAAALAQGFAETAEGARHFWSRGTGGFGFNEVNRLVLAGHEEVDFESLPIAEMEKLLATTGIELRLDDFGGDEPLEPCTGRDGWLLSRIAIRTFGTYNA